MRDVPLDDGRIIPVDFRIHENYRRKLTREDQWCIKWAHRLCRNLPRHSVVIAIRQGVMAYGTGASENEACDAAHQMMMSVRYKWDIPLPKKRGSMAAAFNFTPDLGNANSLGACGVDVAFLLQPYQTERQAGGETAFIDGWINPQIMPKDKEGREQKFIPHRILVQPPWKAKPWL